MASDFLTKSVKQQRLWNSEERFLPYANKSNVNYADMHGHRNLASQAPLFLKLQGTRQREGQRQSLEDSVGKPQDYLGLNTTAQKQGAWIRQGSPRAKDGKQKVLVFFYCNKRSLTSLQFCQNTCRACVIGTKKTKPVYTHMHTQNEATTVSGKTKGPMKRKCNHITLYYMTQV